MYARLALSHERGTIMNRLNFLQILGFTVEIFAFVALIINLVVPSVNGSRLPLYALFILGVIFVAIGNIISRNRNK